ncbi:MAG: TauD/TfdA family dioxygenase [Rhodospirillales bacterium]
MNQMNQMLKMPVGDRSAWKARDIRGRTDWRHDLTGRELDELESALDAVNAKKLAAEDITRADFPLPTLQKRLERILDQVRDGFGFCFVHGVPGEKYSEEDAAKLFWGIGTHLGTAKSQNSHGHLVGHVVDMGGRLGQDRVRGYQTNQTLKFHTDRADISALYCHRTALEGGTTMVASSTAIHNEILATRPEFLPHLYYGYPFMHMEEGGHEEPRRIPVYSVAENYLSCTIQSDPVEKAIKEQVLPVSDEAKEALAYFHALACNPDFHLEFDLKQGEILINNNFTMLHSRTAFVDDPDPARRRHLFRLWLAFDNPRPTVINFANYGGIKKEL